MIIDFYQQEGSKKRPSSWRYNNTCRQFLGLSKPPIHLPVRINWVSGLVYRGKTIPLRTFWLFRPLDEQPLHFKNRASTETAWPLSRAIIIMAAWKANYVGEAQAILVNLKAAAQKADCAPLIKATTPWDSSKTRKFRSLLCIKGSPQHIGCSKIIPLVVPIFCDPYKSKSRRHGETWIPLR